MKSGATQRFAGIVNGSSSQLDAKFARDWPFVRPIVRANLMAGRKDLKEYPYEKVYSVSILFQPKPPLFSHYDQRQVAIRDRYCTVLIVCGRDRASFCSIIRFFST